MSTSNVPKGRLRRKLQKSERWRGGSDTALGPRQMSSYVQRFDGKLKKYRFLSLFKRKHDHHAFCSHPILGLPSAHKLQHVLRVCCEGYDLMVS